MSKIISIHSFRGGTGKSNITANVATIAARRGRRVGIIDTDIQSPGIHVLFGLDEKRIDRTLNDYLWGRCTVEEAAYDVADIASASDRLPDRARSTPAASGAILEMGEGEVAVMGGIATGPSPAAGPVQRRCSSRDPGRAGLREMLLIR